MFISQEKLEKLIEKILEERINNYIGEEMKVMNDRIYETEEAVDAIEEYLDIHYEEKTTMGYVKNKKK